MRGFLCLLLFILTSCANGMAVSNHPSDTMGDKEETYEVHHEMELVKLLIQRYDEGYETTSFSGMENIDLEAVSDAITHLKPFDVKLKMQTVMNSKEKRYEITMTNLDGYYETAKDYVKQTVNSILMDGMSKREKARAIHDYLLEHVTYDKEQLLQKDKTSNAYSPYGALLEKKAVCSGYARAFMMYAEMVDIPCLYVTNMQMDHAWNMIYDGIEWLYIDVTWDEVTDESNTYLNKTKREFFFDQRHSFDESEPETFYRRLGNAYFGR